MFKWVKKLQCRFKGHIWVEWYVPRGYLKLHGKPWRWRKCSRCGARLNGWF